MAKTPEQLEIERLRRAVNKLKAERVISFHFREKGIVAPDRQWSASPSSSPTTLHRGAEQREMDCFVASLLAMTAERRPDGQITSVIFRTPVQPFSQKYSASRSPQITFKTLAIPSHFRGAFRDRHGRGAGRRWTRRLRLTSAAEADGEAVWS
jgi:hypothetical protein